MCVSKVWIFSASTSAFYHFEDPHIHISAHPHVTYGQFTTVLSSRVSRVSRDGKVSRVRVAALFTIRVSRVSTMVSVRVSIK